METSNKLLILNMIRIKLNYKIIHFLLNLAIIANKITWILILIKIE